MNGQWHRRSSRRAFLQLCSPILTSFALVTGAQRSSGSTTPGDRLPSPHTPLNSTPLAQALPLTPACDDGNPTTQQFEGPFFSPNSPERVSLLEPEMTGMRLVLTGQVLSPNCRAIANALVDFWQANSQGRYDNDGYKLRGHQFTDAEGRYRLETVVPGFYPGRTRHLHVKVQVANQPILTTQLYFPSESSNEGDLFFQPELLMAVREEEELWHANFNFVLEG